MGYTRGEFVKKIMDFIKENVDELAREGVKDNLSLVARETISNIPAIERKVIEEMEKELQENIAELVAVKGLMLKSREVTGAGVIEMRLDRKYDELKKEVMKNYYSLEATKKYGWNKHFATNYSWLILPAVAFAGIFIAKKFLKV